MTCSPCKHLINHLLPVRVLDGVVGRGLDEFRVGERIKSMAADEAHFVMSVAGAIECFQFGTSCFRFCFRFWIWVSG